MATDSGGTIQSSGDPSKQLSGEIARSYYAFMIYAPINVLPHHPPLGRKWGFTGGIDTKLLPHYGAFDDRSVSAQIFFVVTSFAMSNPELIPRCNWGQRWGFDTIGLPYYGAFDIRLCQIPTIAPYMPEGGVVGQYIDRCISLVPRPLFFLFVWAGAEKKRRLGTRLL